VIPLKHHRDISTKSLMTAVVISSQQMAGSHKQARVSESSLGSTAGRGLFSSSEFSKGHPIHSLSDPLLVLPDNAQLHQVCEQCLDWAPDSGRFDYSPDDKPDDSVASRLRKNPGIPLKACSGCRVVYYCGKVMSSLDPFWPFVSGCHHGCFMGGLEYSTSNINTKVSS
jgi:hypothetical protein